MDIRFLYGILDLGFWGYVLAAFAMVQFTFMAVTLYLHRDATHRSVDLHPAVRHVFRFWLWEWLAQAEASGIRALRDFAQTLRSYALAPTPA